MAKKTGINEKIERQVMKRLQSEQDFYDSEGNKWRIAPLEMKIKQQSQGEYGHGWKIYHTYTDVVVMAQEWSKLREGAETPTERRDYNSVEVLLPETSLPAVLVDHTPEAVTCQWRKANAGLLEIVRFGAMMVEVDGCLKRQNKINKNGHITGREGGLKDWLQASCPEVSYKTAMGYKVVAEQMRDKYKIPAKLPLTLALPQSDGTINVFVPDNINIEAKKVEQYQREFYGMCEGKSMYQLTLDLGIREPKPRGGALNLPKNFTEVQKLETQQDAAGEYWKGAVENMLFQVKSVKSHLLLSSAQLDQLLVQLRVVRDGLIEASGTEKKEK